MNSCLSPNTYEQAGLNYKSWLSILRIMHQIIDKKQMKNLKN